jgi:hypothetical protein
MTEQTDITLEALREATGLNWFVQQTGGGCTAWEASIGPNRFLWITDDDGSRAPAMSADWLLGAYLVHDDDVREEDGYVQGTGLAALVDAVRVHLTD